MVSAGLVLSRGNEFCLGATKEPKETLAGEYCRIHHRNNGLERKETLDSGAKTGKAQKREVFGPERAIPRTFYVM